MSSKVQNTVITFETPIAVGNVITVLEMITFDSYSYWNENVMSIFFFVI